MVRVLLILHIVFGTAAVAGGLGALLTRKGGPTHRRSGRVFLWCMAVVIGTAAVLTAVHFDPYFAGLTAAAAIAAFSGWRVLRRKRPDVDPAQRATLLDWTVTVALLGCALFILFQLWSGRLVANLPVVRALGYGTAAYALYDLYRFTFPGAFPFGPNLWLYEHLVKMIGAYFGAVAAFSGSVLLFLEPPWRQLWATMLGQTLSLVLVVWYYRQRNRRPARAITSI